MMHKVFLRFSLFLVVLSILVMGSAKSAWACVAPPTIEDPSVRTYPVGQGFLYVVLGGYTTMGVPQGSNCACGFSTGAAAGLWAQGISSIEAIEWAIPVLQGTNRPVPGFGDFVNNEITAADFASRQPGSWTGFLSRNTGEITQGINVDWLMSVKLVPGAREADARRELIAGFIGVGGAAPDGTLVDHVDIRQASAVSCASITPCRVPDTLLNAAVLFQIDRPVTLHTVFSDYAGLSCQGEPLRTITRDTDYGVGLWRRSIRYDSPPRSQVSIRWRIGGCPETCVDYVQGSTPPECSAGVE